VTKDKILILENGEFARFENSELLKIKNDSIKLTQQYTGANQNDIEPSTLYERQQMSENGVICVNLTLKKVEKNVEILNLSISDYGIINYNDSMSKTLLDEIKADARENILGSVSFLKNNQIDFSETKIGIKKLIIKKFERKLKKRPIISTIVTVI
jgi:mRNA degradation ribonuclease J1/J2